MALYHTHRPQLFADIVDQTHIVQTLENQVKMHKVAHAYLFNGPRGVGKTTSARILAKAINCEHRKDTESEPCNSCNSCTEISTSHSIDVIEIDAASHTGVDNVRQNIIENAQFKPTKSKYKVFIIDEVHMLSTAAFNALLKTLEEPPNYIVFVLATTDPQKLPATIISRCQRFTFSKVAPDAMKKHLQAIAKKEGVTIDENVVARIVIKSEGCARDAISLLDQLMAIDSQHITADSASMILPTTHIESHLAITSQLLEKQQTNALQTLEELRADGTSMPHFMTDFILFLRTLLLASVDATRALAEADIAKDHGKQITKLLKQTNQAEIISLIDLAMKRASEIKTAPLPDLPIEMMIIEWTANTSHDTHSTRQGAENSEQKTASAPMKETPVPQKASAPAITDNATTEQSQQFETESPTEKEELFSPIKAEQKQNNNTIPTAIETQPDGFAKEQSTQQDPEENQPQSYSQSSISKKDVEAKWAECIAAIETDMMSLSFVFKMGHIQKVVDNVITLSVGFTFHQERLTDMVTKQKIETIISEVLESKVLLDVVVNEEQANDTKPAASTELNDLAAALGGEVM